MKRGNRRPLFFGIIKARKNWLREPDLNRRPSGYEPDELPGCSIPRPNGLLSKQASIFWILLLKNWLREPLFRKEVTDDRFCFDSKTIKNWLREPDLNRRPSGYEPDELPGCSIPRPNGLLSKQASIFWILLLKNWFREPLF